MVAMDPIRHHMQFVIRLGALRRAYETSLQSLKQDSVERYEASRDHAQRIQVGVEIDSIIEVEGSRVAKSLWLDMEHRAVVEAEIALQKSFVPAVYHFWERSVSRWVSFSHPSRKNPNHSDLVEMAKKAGVKGNLNALQPWHFINNALKHDNGDWIKKLLEFKHDRYLSFNHDVSDDSIDPEPRPHERISFKSADVIELFDLMATLGPDASNPWPDMLPSPREWELA